MDIEKFIIKNPIESTILFLLSMGVDDETVQYIVGNDKFLLLYELEIKKIKPYIKSVNIENIINSLDGQSPSNYLTNGGGKSDNILEIESDPKDRYIRNIIWSTFWFFKLFRLHMSYDNTIITSVFEIIMILYLVMDVFAFGLYKLKLLIGSNTTITDITTTKGKSDMLSNALSYLNSRTNLPDNYTAEKANKDLKRMGQLKRIEESSRVIYLNELDEWIIDEKTELELSKENVATDLEKNKQQLEKKHERQKKRGVMGNALKDLSQVIRKHIGIETNEQKLIKQKEDLKKRYEHLGTSEEQMAIFFENQIMQHKMGDLLKVKKAELNDNNEIISDTIDYYNAMLEASQSQVAVYKKKKEILAKILLPPMEIWQTIMENVEKHDLNPFIFKICFAISNMLKVFGIYKRSLQTLKTFSVIEILFIFVFINSVITIIDQEHSDYHNGGKRKSRRKNKKKRRKSRRVRKNKD